MESSTALKKIIKSGALNGYTDAYLKKLSRIELSLLAARTAIQWGNIHIVTREELDIFRSGLIDIANTQN